MSFKQNRRRKNQKKSTLDFCQLENRNLLAGVYFDAPSGTITVDGSELADAILVQNSGTQIRVTWQDRGIHSFNAAQVNEIVVYGRGGNDWIRNDSVVRMSAFGQAGSNSLIGGPANDVLYGGPERDTISGNDGDDLIRGNAGDDWTNAGAGNDNVYGDDGNDSILGGDGNDRILAGAGHDYINSGNGNDTVYGDSGGDTMLGGAGNDTLVGQDGNDNLDGGSDDDLVWGQNGDDRLKGNFGNDIVAGHAGRDSIFGDLGDDSMFGGDGDDDLTGGSGRDQLRGEGGNDDFFRDSLDNVFEDSGDYNANGDVELRGSVANLNSSARTFSINGVTVNYANARLEGILANGEFFKAEGSLIDGVLVASHVEKKLPIEFRDNFEAYGIISNLNTTARTFDLLGLTVQYGTAEVNGILVDGLTFKVEGNLANGVVTAREVESLAPGLQFQGERNFELLAYIENLDQTARSFTLLGVTVTYSQAQITTNLVNGAFVKVDGNFNGSRLNAREIEAELPDNNNENSELIGAISNLNTATKTFEVLGIRISYLSARVEVGLANGIRVDVEGWFSAGLAMAAERIRAV